MDVPTLTDEVIAGRPPREVRDMFFVAHDHSKSICPTTITLSQVYRRFCATLN